MYMIWDEKIFDNLNKDELKKICNPFKEHSRIENDNCLVIFVFVPIIVKK